METTKNKLTQEESIFFNSLSNYLDTKIYFYGSIQRCDYIEKYSDIDIDIFTNNEKDTIIKLENYLNVRRSDFKKTLCIMEKTNFVIPGYKTKYNNDEKTLNVEISIFNEKYKNIVLESQKTKFNISYIYCILLLVLKILYYKVCIIPPVLFRTIKKFLIGISEDDKKKFVILDMD